MAVLCDFIEIVGDSSVTIGDSQPVWEKAFNTGGRNSSGTALLIFNIKGLTYATSSVAVKINNTTVGNLYPYKCKDDAERDIVSQNWYTQMISVSGSTIKDGNNEIQINAVGYPGATSSNMYDDFQIKNVVCFFHQSS